MNTSSRKGFTVVEMLVVVVLGSLVLLAAYQVLLTNTRVYAMNGARAQGQQTLRAALDVLSGELREISSPGTDLIEMGADSLTIRAQRDLGVVCAVDYSTAPASLAVLPVGPALQAKDSVFVFHDNDTDRSSDDRWYVGEITAVDATATCGTMSALGLTLPVVSATAGASPPDSVRVGGPVRGFEIFTYGQYEVDGEAYLGRRASTATEPDLLVGPLPVSGGIRFRYLDSRGQETKQDTLVAQIEVTLRYQSSLRGFRNEEVSDSVLVRVFPRN
jgi:prepilin-type N-terminal cleavage/methylation domain-containing protein